MAAREMETSGGGLAPALEPLLAPLGGGEGAGRDPARGDDFFVLKAEMARISGNDYAACVERAARILSEQGKDLRVAGYYLAARTWCEGAVGLEAGLDLYRRLLETWGERLHPRRAAARRAALAWLGSPRLRAFVARLKDRLDPATAARLQAGARGLCAALEGEERELVAAGVPAWVEALAEHVAGRPAPPMPGPDAAGPAGRETPAAAAPEGAGPAPGAEPSGPGPQPLSAEQTVHRGRRLMESMLERGERVAAAGLARALRWGTLGDPVLAEGRLRIAPPRPALLQGIRRLIDAGEPGRALDDCSRGLFEPGAQFCLDLQREEHRAALAAEEGDLAALVVAWTRWLLGRWPVLAEAAYGDGTPLASPETRHWLHARCGAETGARDAPQHPAAQAPAPGAAGGPELAELDRLAAAGELAEAARRVEAAPVPYAERWRLRLALGRHLLDQGRSGAALALAEALVDELEQARAAEWAGAELAGALGLVRRALEDRLAASEPTAREALRRRLKAVDRALWRTSPAVALELLG